MKKYLLLVVLLAVSLPAAAKAPSHPYLIVNDSDKGAVLEKIRNNDWAKAAYDNMVGRLEPYVQRHKSDPQWILSRYMMNWTPGKHYTDFYARRAMTIDSMNGNAPYPTVRVAVRGRTPVNAQGQAYRLPPIEEWVPYDTSSRMNLIDPATGKKVSTEPWGLVESVNRQINQLALEAAIVYWLTGDEAYAKFGADILNQFARGAYYQNPIHGPRSFGFVGGQTLNDQSNQPLMLAYDFLYPYLKKKRYEMKYYEPVWDKFAHTALVNGYWNNNWYAAESCTLVYAALLLEDQQKKDFYVEHFLNKDTIDGSWGHLSVRSTVDKWLTPDGHWKEPGGYHTYPVSNLLKASLTMEKNGYPVFDKYPALFDAASVPMKYVYPNLYNSSFGDSGRSVPSSELLEVALIFAGKDKPDALPQLLACADLLAKNGFYNRSRAGEFGLLCYLPEIKNDKGYTYEWPRSGTLDFAKFYLQRNGMNKDYGLMYTIQCATYNHNHVNGMSMELYGTGDVMGIDPATGPYYEHPMHMTYYAQWAAHNTVVAAGRSASVPYSGGAGTKRVGELEMRAMEPAVEAQAVSPYVSFTDSRYVDRSTETNQQRTMALIRTSDKSGYYVDIFRSDNPQRNDYMYHNIGNSVELFTPSGEKIPVSSAEIELVGDDYPGFRHISEVKATGKYLGDVVARFTLNEGAPQVRYMQAIIPYNVDRNYYTGYSPKATTASAFSQEPLPTLMVQAGSEAWAAPFVVVYEPYYASDGASVRSVTKLSRGNESQFVTLLVDNRDGSQQYIFQGLNDRPSAESRGNNFSFQGYFGVASLKNGNMDYLYLGAGKKLDFGDYIVEGGDANASANVEFTPGGMRVTANQPVTITLKKGNVSGASMQSSAGSSTLNVTKSDAGTTISLPAGRDMVITLR